MLRLPDPSTRLPASERLGSPVSDFQPCERLRFDHDAMQKPSMSQVNTTYRSRTTQAVLCSSRGLENGAVMIRGMPNHTTLRTLAATRPASRLALGLAALALTLPLAACDTGVDPRNPSSPSPTESSETTSPSDDASKLDPTGKWSSPEKGDPFLEFAEDGSLEALTAAMRSSPPGRSKATRLPSIPSCRRRRPAPVSTPG